MDTNCVRCGEHSATHRVERVENGESIVLCDPCALKVATIAGDRSWAVRVTTLRSAA